MKKNIIRLLGVSLAVILLTACGRDSDPSAPHIPVNVTATADNRQATITWDAVDSSEFYIYWATAPGVSTSDNWIAGAASPYLHTGLRNGTAYYYAVTAVSAASESALSKEVSAIPNFTNEMLKKLLAPDAAVSDLFGVSVAISGDYAVVGANGKDTGGTDAGAAYIFLRTGTNTWDSGTKVMGVGTEVDDLFGVSVAISGDYAVVGANRDDNIGGFNAGGAYIFLRTGPNTWDSGTKIMALDAEADDNFAISVAISGDYVIVGANGEDTGGTDAGAAYIFLRTGPNTWDSGTKIMAPDTEADDGFGISVAISGDYAVVGANREDTGGTDAGAAYIFLRTGPNTWDSGTKIMAPDIEADDGFGISVAISGDYAVVGANGEDTDGTDAGAAYIFLRTGPNTWDSGTKIMAPDAEGYDWFGISVAADENYVIVGANGEDTGGSDAGAAYIFLRTGTNTWDTGTKIMAPDAEGYDWFGISVAADENYVIVGANGEDNTGGSNAGAVYMY